MSSKLNPNAGAWVPSFVSSTDAKPATAAPGLSPVKPKKSAAPSLARKTSPIPSLVPTVTPTAAPQVIESHVAFVDDAQSAMVLEPPQAGRICIGRTVNGRLHYSIAELLQFRALWTTPPPDLQLGPIISGGPKDRPAKAPKKEKSVPAGRAPMLHYDPSALPYFKVAMSSPVSINTAQDGASSGAPATPSRQPPKATDDPEKETKEALEAIEKALASPAHDTWLPAIQQVPVTCTPTLQAAVGLLFDRAIAAPASSDPFAQLCSALSESLPEFKDGARTVNFRRVLLTKCYEALVEEPSSPHAWRRQCMLGNVGFVGELFRRQLLTENVMHVCVAMMLDGDEDGADVVPEPAVLEAACRLLLLVGDLLDGSSPASRRTMDEYFDALQRLACSSQLPLAQRPLLQETLDMRSGGWVRRRAE
ncbi:hypothetical protein ACHHYP_10124 [Achlya hypogyna]|uniref:MIF4G domain-containing protein n=1 Tax=Achlya hypogyna TaxID=1202772 RepID=A0A1V9ZI52_ACHHY|nr:hypothetical protein ACHHYP_10124 [Achlya hypogyna]